MHKLKFLNVDFLYYMPYRLISKRILALKYAFRKISKGVVTLLYAFRLISEEILTLVYAFRKISIRFYMIRF